MYFPYSFTLAKYTYMYCFRCEESPRRSFCVICLFVFHTASFYPFELDSLGLSLGFCRGLFVSSLFFPSCIGYTYKHWFYSDSKRTRRVGLELLEHGLGEWGWWGDWSNCVEVM